jgi:hypothetical protein
MESCALQLEFSFPAYVKGPSGVWRLGERSAFFAPVPPDVDSNDHARTCQKSRARQALLGEFEYSDACRGFKSLKFNEIKTTFIIVQTQ